MSHVINATLTRTWDNKPLVTLDGGPFNGVERTPAQLRALAVALVRAASMAEARPTTGRHWAPKTVVLDLEPAPAKTERVRDAQGFAAQTRLIGEGWVPALPGAPGAHRPAGRPCRADSGARSAAPESQPLCGPAQPCAMPQTRGGHQ